MDELDEFNEAPHSLRSESSTFQKMQNDEIGRMELYDDDFDDDDQNQIINILDRTVPGRIETNDLITTNDLLINDNITSMTSPMINDHIAVDGTVNNHFSNNSNQNQTTQQPTYLLNSR